MDLVNQWEEELQLLKSIIVKAPLDIAIKWGGEVYTYNGKNVLSIAGFKHFFVLWFYNGVFLKDSKGKLINAQEGKTKALRQWRFTHRNEIDEKLITAYIKEAIQNEVDGKVWKPQQSKDIEIPALMQQCFKKDKNLKSSFDALSLSKKKDYIEYINTAKKEATQISRMEKISSLILQGVGLHDKYK